MKITLSPTNHHEPLIAHVNGDVLTVNGTPLDFTNLADGSTLPLGAVSNKWIAGDVRRQDGEIYLTLLLPHGSNASDETRFPVAQNEPVTVIDGNVPLPPYELNE